MKKGNLPVILFASVGMLVLILDGKTAVTGIQRGIDICLQTLIPSLFPFFVISGLLTASLVGQSATLLRPLGRLCRIPESGESFLAVGILGGYPVGAKNLRDAYLRGDLSLENARRMAVFCNNAGPSFLFGILGPLFPERRYIWTLWLIQITGAILTGIVMPGGFDDRSFAPLRQSKINISHILNRALISMAAVCGWVMLFRMVLEFLQRWILWLFPIPAQILFTGLLELSNGCINLRHVEEPSLQFQLASLLLSAGGVCILMQTKSVFPELDMKKYLSGKLLQISICMILSLLTIPILTGKSGFAPYLAAVIIILSGVFYLIFSRKRKKEVAIP